MHSPLIETVKDLRTRLTADLDALVASVLRDDKTVLRNLVALRERGEQIISAWSGEGTDRRRPGESSYEGVERRDPWVVVFGDINDFKAFNSKHGHDRADFAIVEAGRQLQLIAEDCKGEAFRRSGDEFIILLPCSQVEALRVRLREIFAACSVAFDECSDVFGMSFGYCVVEQSLTFEDLLKRAEIACEFAKRSGAGALVAWTLESEAQLPQASRRRCSTCKTVVSLLIPPEFGCDAESLPCPVCTAGGSRVAQASVGIDISQAALATDVNETEPVTRTQQPV